MAASEPDNEAPTHASVLKAVGAGAVILTLAVLLAKGYFWFVNRTAPAPLKWRTSLDLDRVKEIRAAIPGIAAKEQPSAFVLGPSVAFYGFHPQVFDDAMRERGVATVSYNIAALGNISETDRLLTLRLRDAFAAEGRRPKLVVFVFTPISASRAFLEGRTRPHLRKRAVLSTPGELASLFFQDPHKATELATLRFYGGTGAADANSLIAPRIFRGPVGIEGGGPPSEWQNLSHEVSLGYARQIGHFDEPTRGLFNPLEGNDPAKYERMADLAFSPDAIALQSEHWDAPDFVNVVLERDRIDWFVDAVGIARQFADHVAIVVPPTSDLVRNNDEGKRNIAAALEEIETRTGIELVDLRDRGFVQGDFVDFTHLRYTSGAPKFTRMIAEAVAPQMTSAKGNGS